MKAGEIPTGLNVEQLQEAISAEYAEVANTPEKGFHFNTGRPLAKTLDYRDEWLDVVPENSMDSFAGTGNPFSLGEINSGETVVDVGSGAGTDSLIAASMVGPAGKVTGVDMTVAMLEKSQASAEASGAANVQFVKGQAEALPLEAESVDVVISNGVFNLVPGKATALKEMFRVLKPGGRLQIADILLERELSDEAKAMVDLWTG